MVATGAEYIDFVTARPRRLRQPARASAPSGVVLVELPSEEVLTRLTDNGAELKSSAREGDEVFLCTSVETLACKHVDTTNLLLVCDVDGEYERSQSSLGDENRPDNAAAAAGSGYVGLLTQQEADAAADDHAPIIVNTECHFTVETSRAPAPVLKLDRLLDSAVLYLASLQALQRGEEEAPGLTWTELKRRVPACDIDIQSALTTLDVCPLETPQGWLWCKLNPLLRLVALEALLLTCAEHGARLAGLNMETLTNWLQESGDPLSLGLLEWNGSLLWYLLCTYARFHDVTVPLITHGAAPSPSRPNSASQCAFDMKKIAQAMAELSVARLLDSGSRGTGTTIPVTEFLKQFRECMPETDSFPELPSDAVHVGGEHERLLKDILKGTALYNPATKTLTVLRECDLPLQAQARFRELFRVQTQWNDDEIAPYLARMQDGDCRSSSDLLLKHTRACRETMDAEPSYMMRGVR